MACSELITELAASETGGRRRRISIVAILPRKDKERRCLDLSSVSVLGQRSSSLQYFFNWNQSFVIIAPKYPYGFGSLDSLKKVFASLY